MARTLRFVSIIVVAVFTISALTYTAVTWRTEARCEAYHSDGIRALELEQFTLAAEKLGKRLDNSSCGDSNTDLLYAYARARARLPEPGSKHLVESVRALKQAVLIEPGAAHAWRELALAWLGMGEPARAVDAARKVVALDPADHAAFRILLTALLATGKNHEVRDLATQALKQAPQRWWLHFARLSALSATRASLELVPADITHLTNEQRLLIESYSAILQGREDEAKQALQAITVSQPLDTLYLQTFVNLLGGIEMHTKALELLHQQRFQLAGKLRREYLELAWQSGRTEWILDYLTQQPARIDQEPALLLLQTLASKSTSVDNLQLEIPFLSDPGVKESQAQQRWRRLLQASRLQNDDAELVDALEQVLEIEPRNIVVLQLLSEAWIRLQEPLRAARVAERTMQLARGWARPALTRAQALLRAGRPMAALQSAREATRRAPDDPLTGLVLAQAWAQNLGPDDHQGATALLKLLDTLQTETLIADLVSLDPIRRIATARLEGRTGIIKDSPDTVKTENPDKQAVNPSLTEVPDAERIMGCNAKTTAAAHTACWKDLMNRHPGNLSTSLLALSSAANRGNAQFQLEIIEQIRALTPQSSGLWRLARARLILSSETTEKTAAEAALLLRYALQRSPDQADAHLLMANAMAHLGDRTTAGAHLSEAVAADPSRSRQALQVSLYLASEVIKIEPRTLLGWWESITWLESAYISRQSLSVEPLQSQSNLKANRLGQARLISRLNVLAGFAETRSDAALAEAVYRRILQLDNNAHIANNNLAMILSGEKSSLDEALMLARRAVEIRPSSNDYRDTLEVVLAAKKSHSH
ncbi:MAG: tetratricopeptide repeat protein [Proteobacteria bacterium]|nr:tetratricopeptide repeat protein [Pseudomonadota bacterium]